jgi:hypothetical protein
MQWYRLLEFLHEGPELLSCQIVVGGWAPPLLNFNVHLTKKLLSGSCCMGIQGLEHRRLELEVAVLLSPVQASIESPWEEAAAGLVAGSVADCPHTGAHVHGGAGNCHYRLCLRIPGLGLHVC